MTRTTALTLSAALALTPAAWADEPAQDKEAEKQEANTPKGPDEPTATTPVSAPIATPMYKLPKVGKPRRRVGGGRRGPAEDQPELFTLVPEHVGLTASASPTLYWYIDAEAKGDVAFELTLIDDESIQPLVDTRLTHPETSGLQAIRLADHGVELAPGQEYQWSVALVPSQGAQSQALVSSGWVERVPEPGAVAAANAAGPDKAAAVYAEAGLWYDALDSAAAQVEADPGDAQARKNLAALLGQVGLPERAATQ
jgi:hypothetical protein